MRIWHLVVTAVFLLTSLSADAQNAPVDLRSDGGVDPLGGSAAPRLTWRITSQERRVEASAWQVLVSTNEAKLAKDIGDLWDSGKVPAEREPGLLYNGPLPVAGERCHWKVRWWGADDKPSPWSEPAVWEVAPDKPDAWKGARWMDDGRDNPATDQDLYDVDPAPLMRREFTLDKPVLRARLHVSGLGLCQPSLDGKALDDHVFDPPWTNFDERILFRTLDVTDHLTEGTHCLGLMLGNGWYNPLPLRMWGHRNIRDALPVGRPRVIACLVVEHPDGTSTTVTSGPGWTTAPGATLRNNIYLGEERDARLDPGDWDSPDFDDDGWKPTRVTDHPLEPLRPLRMPPVRLKEAIAAKAVTMPAGGVHIVDFGQNFTGIPEIKLRAPAGTRITFRYGELLNEDGSLNPMTSVAGQIKGVRVGPDGEEVPIGGPGSPEVAWQQDVYISKGGETETFRPRFTFHGFRYMEITGLPDAPDVADFRAFPLRTDLAPAGAFSCSDDDLNRIQEMCRRTFLANVVTVQSDCPHRERFGYGGDIVATAEAFMMNFRMDGFYAKTVRDWADAARPDGRLTDTAPFVGIDYCGVGWAMVHPFLLEQLHRHYGAGRLLEEQVPVAMLWLETEAAARKDGLVTQGLGDHEALTNAGGPEFLTPMFIDSARRVARLARIIGRDDDANRFDAMADESAIAWEEAYLDKSNGQVADGTQSAQCFALGFGAAPDEARDAIFEQLVRDLTAPKDGPRLTTGIFGTRILLEVLSQNGRSDLALALADREAFPSWNWMLQEDATTLWEHWEGSDNTFSHNHPMFGSVSAWFFRWLGGIQCADDAVAFDRLMLRPQVVPGLDWVKSSHQSVRGPIESNWSVSGDERHYEFVIPPGVTAIVELPIEAGDDVTEGGRPLDELPEIRILEGTPGLHRFDIGSGHYRFTVTGKS